MVGCSSICLWGMNFLLSKVFKLGKKSRLPSCLIHNSIAGFARHMKSEIYCKGCRNSDHIKGEPRLFMSIILISLITISLPSKRLHYKTQNVIYIHY